MRSNIGRDQAEGLRRLLVRARHGEAEPSGAGVPASHLLPQSAGYAGNVSEMRNQMQVITVVAGKAGVGRTSATINLAAALAYSGKDVLVLDENHAPNNVLDRLELYAKHDLLDVAQGKCAPGEAVLVTKGFAVLHTARAMQEFSKLDQIERQRMEDALTEVSSGVDVMLVDAAMPVLSKRPVSSKVKGLVGQAAVSSSLASAAALLVVADATASGITESYALIKRLALEDARLHFEIVINKVTGEQAAMTVFENMARVARHNLAARLEYLGYIPSDDRLRRATQMGKPVVEAFPTAVSAKFYVELAQKLLRLPMRQDEVEGGVSRFMQNLTKQLARQHSREMMHVVN